MSKDNQTYEGEVLEDETKGTSASDGIADLIDVVKSVVLAVFNEQTPTWTKVLAGVAVVYLLLPLDLVPGPIDDAVIVPLLFSICWKFIPEEVKSKVDFANNGLRATWKQYKRRIIIIGIIAVVLYLALIGLIIWGSLTIAKS